MPLKQKAVATLSILAGLLCISSASVYTASARADDMNRPRAFRHAAPGNIDYYTLALSWSPTHCLVEGHARGDAQCGHGRDPDFVLHGFWPQYAKGWPEDCYAGSRPWVPSSVIDEMRGLMQSKELVIHEYKTHGTCSGLTPRAYFAAARKAYTQVHIPKPFDDPKTQRFLSPEAIESAFITANNWLEADMIAVTCRRRNLFDVRICFDTDIAPQACGTNINQKRLCPLRRITVTAPQKR